MPPPMVPAPMMPTLRMGRVGVSLGHIENMRCRALGLKHVAQRRRFGRQHQGGKQFALPLQSRIEGPVERGRHRLYAGHGRGITARHSFDGSCARIGRRPHGSAWRPSSRARASSPASRHHPPGQSPAPSRANHLRQRRRTAACPRSFSEATVGRRGNHVNRGFGADQPWQPLRAAGARQQPQLHFRQRDFGARGSHPIMAAQAPVPSRRPCTRR